MTKLQNLTAENEYRQVQCEDGPAYDAWCGFRVIGRELIEGGTAFWSHFAVLRTEDEAQRLIDRINAAGGVINEQHWDKLGEDRRTWDDIELEWMMESHRERMECL